MLHRAYGAQSRFKWKNVKQKVQFLQKPEENKQMALYKARTFSRSNRYILDGIRFLIVVFNRSSLKFNTIQMHKGDREQPVNQKIRISNKSIKEKERRYLLGVQQVIVESLLLPIHGHAFVSSRVRISWSCSRLPSKQTVQIRSCIIRNPQFNHKRIRNKNTWQRNAREIETPIGFGDDIYNKRHITDAVDPDQNVNDERMIQKP